jgi:transcriptional regulator with GAF, ATPase, and Fis domain
MATTSNLSPIGPLAQLADQLVELVRVMSDGQARGLQSSRIVQFAAQAVPGSEHCAITLMQGRSQPSTVAASDEVPLRVDNLQYSTGQGPCLQALAQSDIAQANDLLTDQQWPAFAAQAVTVTGIRSMLSFRLYLDEHAHGALNFYSSKPDAFDEAAVAVGAIFASYASLTMLNTLQGDEILQLNKALQSNREIGVAIGILMACTLTTQEEAFDRLRVASQHLHVKLRDIASEVVRIGELPNLPPLQKAREKSVSAVRRLRPSAS